MLQLITTLRCAAVLIVMFTGAVGLVAQGKTGLDWESWSEVDVSWKVKGTLTLTVPMVVRNSFTLPDPQLVGFGPFVDWAIAKQVTVTGAYLFVVLPNAGHGYSVNVPLAAVTFRGTLKRLQVSDRSRVEGLIGLPNNPIRYRNKLVFNLPFANEKWSPFLADEAFYDFSQSAWSQNRLQVGIGRVVSPRVRLDIFYLERNARHGNPTASHVIGTTLEIKIDREARRKGLPHEEN